MNTMDFSHIAEPELLAMRARLAAGEFDDEDDECMLSSAMFVVAGIRTHS